jgi:hypothetical protein
MGTTVGLIKDPIDYGIRRTTRPTFDRDDHPWVSMCARPRQPGKPVIIRVMIG